VDLHHAGAGGRWPHNIVERLESLESLDHLAPITRASLRSPDL
jgi:hypothetical protein